MADEHQGFGAATWDERYAAAGLVWSAEPNRFVADAVAGLAPGRALDLGCGEGRNSIWLAERGWSVTGVDFSAVGLAKAARLAEARGVEVRFIEADVCAWQPPADGFDLVVVAYLQLGPGDRRRALDVAAASVAPGGALIFVAHDAANLDGGVGGPSDPAVLYSAPEVADALEARGLSVARAEQVLRPVMVDGHERRAIDVLAVGRRDGPG